MQDIFSHWNTKADGTGTTYKAGATYSANTSVTLYAIWAAHTDSCYNIMAHTHTGSATSGGSGICYATVNYCYGQIYTDYGSHYVHSCRSCSWSAANYTLADQDSDPGADCDEHYGGGHTNGTYPWKLSCNKTEDSRTWICGGTP